MSEPAVELILGGARSGKSRLAEQRARSFDGELVYIATATADDDEMQERIAHHQSRRGDEWQLVESPLLLADTLRRHAGEGRILLVDCLTLWLSNALAADCWEQEKNALFQLLPQLPGRVILVSNEVGSGIVPLGELSRRFADESGFLHQRLAEIAQRVTLVVAGLPLSLKPTTVTSH